MLGLSLAMTLGNPTLNAGGGVSPVTILGASLLAWWTADRADLITLNSTAVTSWKDVVAGYDAVQGVSAARPLYSATSFNGAPGLTFDGVDDELTSTDASLLLALPDAAEAGELQGVVQQGSLAADTAARYLVAYGNGVNAARRLSRIVVGGVNRAAAQVGTGAANTVTSEGTVDFSTRHYHRGVFAVDMTTPHLDGTSGAGAAAVPATTASRLRIGSNDAASAGSFFNGIIRDILVTGPLSAEQIAAIQTWALARRML